MLLIFAFGLFWAVANAQNDYLFMAPCKGTKGQQFAINQGPRHRFITATSTHSCLDVTNYGTKDGSIVWSASCHPQDTQPAHQNQDWNVISSNESVVEIRTGKCLTRFNGTVVISTCVPGNQDQTWQYVNQTFRKSGSNICLDNGNNGYDFLYAPCDNSTNKDLPFCNVALSFKERSAWLVGNLTNLEKYALFNTASQGVPRLGIPAYQWWNEALHGVGDSPFRTMWK